MLEKVTTPERPAAESTEPEPKADSDSDAEAFKTAVRFMFMIPTAVLVFLLGCAAVIAYS